MAGFRPQRKICNMETFTHFGDIEYLDANLDASRVALVMHWGGASGRLGLPFAHLLPGWRIIAPSLRGHGHTTLPAADVETCAADVLVLLDHLGVCHIDRLYAYSLGAYTATHLFGKVEIAEGVLISGGVVPFGVCFPHVFEEQEPEQPETQAWLDEQRTSIESSARSPEDIEAEWRMMLLILDDIADLTQPRLTFRHSVDALRPTIESIWNADYFAAPKTLPSRLLFVNTNGPDACHPYVERFASLPGCREATMPVDPFDVRSDTVWQVIALLEQ